MTIVRVGGHIARYGGAMARYGGFPSPEPLPPSTGVYTFDNTLVDSSGEGNNLTCPEGFPYPTYDNIAPAGFPGSQCLFGIGNPAGEFDVRHSVSLGNTFSVSLWYYMGNEGVGTQYAIFSSARETSYNGITLRKDAGEQKIVASWWNGSTLSTAGDDLAITPDTWTHIVLTYSGGVARVYKNTSLGITFYPTATSDGMIIGNIQNNSVLPPNKYFYYAGIGKTYTFDSVLTGTQISYLYNGGDGR